MKTLEYHSINNKLELFGPGPWVDEPDKVQWADHKTGLPCLIRRNPVMGILCGYVGVPKGHPFYEIDYEILESELDVHGGLTFSDHCHHNGDESTNICHVIEDGESDDVWWLGFDCCHCDDLNPHMKKTNIGWFDGEYRDIAYVKEECRKLAKQIAQ